MNGKYIRLTPPSETEVDHTGKLFVQFDPKTIYLVEGADPIVLGRASSRRESNRMNDPDNGYLKVPTGQTALGREHALLCVRNNALYIAMKDRDGMLIPAYDDMAIHSNLLSPRSEAYYLRNHSRVRLGINGAVDVKFLVDVIFEISDNDKWSFASKKRFIRDLPA